MTSMLRKGWNVNDLRRDWLLEISLGLSLPRQRLGVLHRR